MLTCVLTFLLIIPGHQSEVDSDPPGIELLRCEFDQNETVQCYYGQVRVQFPAGVIFI